MRNDSAVESLTQVERLQLVNQFRILEKLDPDNADHYAESREIIARGYSILYEKVFHDVYEEMPIEDCKYVYDVLDLHRVLINSFNTLKDKQGLTEDDVKFHGFDGNNESKMLALAEYLQKDGLWTETLVGYLNSHSMTTKTYKRMLTKFKPIEEQILSSGTGRWILTAEQIREIIS